MLKFALKNMAVKKAQILLVVLSIVISAAVVVLAYNTAEQVNDGINGTAGYYAAIVGPAGSQTQLAMNTMYFTDEPLGTLPYSLVSELRADARVKAAIPYAMADSYNGYSVVGTESAYLDGKTVGEGRLFSDGTSREVVLGATVARVSGVSVGDAIYTSHSVGEEHTTPLTVVGILSETHTAYDKVVFTELSTIWEVHEEEEEEEHEEHDHDEMDGMVCAILIKAEGLSGAMTLVNEYKDKIYTDPDGDTFSVQAIEPMATVRNVLEETDNTKYIVFVLCAIILLMNIIIISIITLLNMIHSQKEIALMRLIGIGMNKINLLYVIQNSLIGIVSTVLAFLVAHVCLLFMGGVVASRGVVLNPMKVYPLEIVILLAVFVISVLPTVITTFRMARRDGLSD